MGAEAKAASDSKQAEMESEGRRLSEEVEKHTKKLKKMSDMLTAAKKQGAEYKATITKLENMDEIRKGMLGDKQGEIDQMTELLRQFRRKGTDDGDMAAVTFNRRASSIGLKFGMADSTPKSKMLLSPQQEDDSDCDA